MKLNSIQFLRGVAALLVVYEHSISMQAQHSQSYQQNFFHLYHFGCIGVDLFFVISGFIISYVAANDLGFGKGLYFLHKRFWRINPIYYIATVFYLTIIIFNIWLKNEKLWDHQIVILNSLIDGLFIIPTTGTITSFSPLLIVGWTLSFEWLFYFLYFLLIVLNVKKKTFYIIGLIFSLILFGKFLGSRDFRLIFITNPIMLEFTLGVLIFWLYNKYKSIHVTIGIGLLSIGLTAYTYMILKGSGNVYYFLFALNGKLSFSRFIYWGIPSSCIVAGCIILEKNRRIRWLWNNSLSKMFGDASYSIYLIHYPILVLFQSLYTITGFFLPADAMIWFQLIIALLISLTFYLKIEKPLLDFFKIKKISTAQYELNPKKVYYE